MDLSVVNKLLEPFLKENNLELFDVELVKEFGYLILRVSIDRKGGIDVDTLASVNEFLSEAIEGYDNDMPEYMLEVCSPGAEKPLRSHEEIMDSIGMYVHVEIPGMIYEGILEDATEETVCVKVNAKGRFKKIVINKTDIKIIRLAVKI